VRGVPPTHFASKWLKSSSTHYGEYDPFQWHNRCNQGKEQRRDGRAAKAGAKS
jgi:hypothetical protein